MIAVTKEGILLQKTTPVFENEGVLNPAVLSGEDCFHLFYRAVSKGNYSSIGSNHLHQVIYNHCTGGCYDGLEENYVNLNQGTESTVSYPMARLTVDPDNYLPASVAIGFGRRRPADKPGTGVKKEPDFLRNII